MKNALAPLLLAGLMVLGGAARAADVAPFKVAAVEFNPQLFEFRQNIEPLCAIVKKAAEAGAKIIVLPETATSGYIYKDRRQFDPYLDTVPGETTDAVAKLTKQFDCYVTVGIAEIDRATGLAFNTAALIGPEGYIGKYRKVGLNSDDQLWFTIGNLGYPVFDTKYGKLAMEICYDDTYWEVGRTAAVKGAQIMCFMSSSDRALPGKPGSAGNHSTISAVQGINSWNGVALIATDRNNSESNPTTGLTVYYGGIAAIWSPTGKKLAQAAGTSPDVSATAPPQIIYATIDPAEFENPIKASFAERRPEIYTPLTFYRSPTDPKASTTRHSVNAQLVQYAPTAGDLAANCDKIVRLLGRPAWKPDAGRLIVLPEYSLSGPPASAADAKNLAETLEGPSVQMLATLANQMNSHVVFSFIHSADGKLTPATVLLGPDGEVIGTYGKTHLDAGEKEWATAGDAFPVFDTKIGRIGLLQGGDVRFPEAAGCLTVNRADIIAIPSSWRGQYGGYLDVSPALFAERYPANTMKLWYSVAKNAQAYTLAANYAGGDYRGASGLFTLNPVDANDPPVVAGDQEQCLAVQFTTLADPGWWMSQQSLVGGRRVDLCAPLTFPLGSEAFKTWKSAPGFDLSIWANFGQEK